MARLDIAGLVARHHFDRPTRQFWLHRQLEAHGVRNYVIGPASLQVDRRARRLIFSDSGV
jgi:hypothetical protein